MQRLDVSDPGCHGRHARLPIVPPMPAAPAGAPERFPGRLGFHSGHLNPAFVAPPLSVCKPGHWGLPSHDHGRDGIGGGPSARWGLPSHDHGADTPMANRAAAASLALATWVQPMPPILQPHLLHHRSRIKGSAAVIDDCIQIIFCHLANHLITEVVQRKIRKAIYYVSFILHSPLPVPASAARQRPSAARPSPCWPTCRSCRHPASRSAHRARQPTSPGPRCPQGAPWAALHVVAPSAAAVPAAAS